VKKIGRIWTPDRPVPCQSNPYAWTEAALVSAGRVPDGYATGRAVVEEDTKAEREICRVMCPLREQCLESALLEEGSSKAPQRYGIRGALLPWERETEYKKRRAVERARAKEAA